MYTIYICYYSFGWARGKKKRIVHEEETSAASLKCIDKNNKKKKDCLLLFYGLVCRGVPQSLRALSEKPPTPSITGKGGITLKEKAL